MSIFGFLFSLPQQLLFFAAWIIYSLTRPLILVSLVTVASKPSAALRKLQFFVTSIQFLLFSNDKKWPKQSDPDAYFTNVDADKIQRKTIIFVRHGESTWNDTFNPGDRPKLSFLLYFIPNLLKAIALEWYFWVSCQETEIWFYDSPLSEKGLLQAKNLQAYLRSNLEFLTPKESDMLKLLIDTSSQTSQLVSSNLRRSISTMIVGFQDRLRQSSDKDTLLILSDLQEISFNPDALSILPAAGADTVAFPAWSDPRSLHQLIRDRVDTRLHQGNKAITSNGLQRMQQFCHTVFDVIDQPHVIAGGHSLWFRSFFQTYLPHKFTHVCKRKKLMNGGVVGFVLERTKNNDEWVYRIDPSSIVVLLGGF